MRHTSQVHGRGLRDTSQVHVWYMRGTCVVHAWYMRGTCVVHAWYMRGTCVVHAWYMRGTCEVKARCKPGTNRAQPAPTALGRRVCSSKPDLWRGLVGVPEREGVFFLHEQALAGGDGVGVGLGVGDFIRGKLLVFLVAGFEDGEVALGGEREQD